MGRTDPIRRREAKAHGKSHLKGFYTKIEARRAVGETGVDPVREAEAQELLADQKLLELEREAAAAEEEKEAAEAPAAEEEKEAAEAAVAEEEREAAEAAAAAKEQAAVAEAAAAAKEQAAVAEAAAAAKEQAAPADAAAAAEAI